MVNIIFEGVDCSGKGTLIKNFFKLSKNYYKLFHFQRPPENMLKQRVKQFQQDIFYLFANYLLFDDNIIFDRYHIGELVYGKLYRGFTSDIPGFEQKVASLPDPAPQVTDFHEAVQNRLTFALNERNGHRSCTIVNLGVVALRLRRSPRHRWSVCGSVSSASAAWARITCGRC